MIKSIIISYVSALFSGFSVFLSSRPSGGPKQDRSIEAFRRQKVSGFAFDDLSWLLDLAEDHPEVDDALLLLSTHSNAIPAYILSHRPSDVLIAKRPDLVVRILEASLETYGRSALEKFTYVKIVAPSQIAAIRRILGPETMITSRRLNGYETRLDRMGQHFLGPMSSHKWLEMIHNLGTAEDILRNPQAVEDYFDRLDAS